MNVPRKPPSVSPPVQVQTQQQSRGAPHYATRGQTPPIAYRTLNQEDFQRNQVFSQAQVSVNNNYPIQFSPGFAGSNPHDMSKQQALPPHVTGPGQNQGQPGLQTQVMYTNPTQQHQGAGPRPGTPSGASSALGGAGYHSASNLGNAAPMQYHPMGTSPMTGGQEEGVSFTIPRQTVQPSIRAGQQRQQIAMASSPGQPMYNQSVHATTMYVHQQPPPHFMHGQPQVIIQPGPPPPIQVPPQYTTGPRPNMPTQFTITSQPNYIPQQQPTTSTQQQATQMPQNAGGMVHQQPQRPMAQQQQQPYMKRERKIIRIVDPNTGQDISDEIMASTNKASTPPQSGPNSSRATPVTGPPAGTTPPPVAASPNTAPPPKPEPAQSAPVDIAAQFAAQVAATLSQKNAPQLEKSQQQRQASPAGTASEEDTVTAAAEQPQVVESEEPRTATPSSDADSKPSQSREASEPREEAEPSPEVTEEVVEPESVVPVTVTPPTPEAHAQKEPSPEPVTEEVPEPEVEEETKKEEEVEQVVAEVKEEKEEEEEKEKEEEKEAPVEPTPAAEEEPEPVPATVEETKETESKEKKKSKKQKQKELNQKGDSKEGSDMDAFSIPSTTSTPPPPTSAAAPAPVAPTPAAQPQAQAAREKTPPTSSTPAETKAEVVEPPPVKEPEPSPSAPAPETKTEVVLEEPPIEKIEIKVVEDEKVTEKNEKNEEPWRKIGGDEPWRKPKTSSEPWRKSPAPVEEERRTSSKEKEDSKTATTTNSDTTTTSTTTEKNALNEKSTTSTKAAEKSTTSSKISDNKPVIDKDSSDLKHKYREGQVDGSLDSNNRVVNDVQNNQTESGRKSYDRNFLLQMQFSSESLEKPDGLPRLPDVILDKPLSRNDTNRGMPALKPGSVVDFTPGFFKTTPAGGKGGSQSMGRNRSQQKNVKDDGRKRIITISHLDTKLHQSENAWKPSAHQPRKQEPGKEGDGETDEILKTVRAILNKLTPEKFQTLIKQIANLKLDTFDRLKRSIDLIFEKAIDEPAFSSTYANLCKCMCPIKVPLENKPEESVAFKKLLLLRCQTEFEKDRSDEESNAKAQKVIDDKKKMLSENGPNKELEREIAILDEERILAEQKSRRRYLGNIRFIGELFKLGILNEPIMHSCLQRLMGAMDEESLECLCRLLTTIGKSIDTDEKEKKAKIDDYFFKLTRLAGDRKISARIRFMIQDVIDLRLNNWVPRRDDNKPKTIRELHKEIQLEDQQKQQHISNIIQMSKPTGGHHGDGGRGRRGRGAGGVSEDGWQSVSKPLRTQTIEPNKMNQIKLSRHNMDSDNITLGSGFSGWGRGSSGGGGKSSREERSLQSTPNRFSPLSNERNPGRDSYEQGRSGSAGRGGLSQSRDRDRDRGGDRDRGDRGGWTTQTSRGKNVPRASQEHDREAALSAVSKNLGGVSRSMAGGGRSSTPTGSRTQSLDKGRREGTREREVEKAPPVATLSVAEIKKKTEALLMEYLGLLDVKEAIACVKELESPSLMNVMVSTALNHTIEKNQKARIHTAQLMAQLIKEKIITPEHYLAGLDEILEFADDMAIDIPKIWQYLGELVGPVVEDRAVELVQLRLSCDLIQATGKTGLFMAETLNNVATRKDKDHAAQLWFDSGLQWSDFIGDSNVNEFAKRYNVEYLLPTGGPLSMKRVQDKLTELIVDVKASNEVVFQWVAANVGDKPKYAAFTRALMTAVCSSAITENSLKVDNQIIRNRSAMMMKYLDHDAELELQALYALQALVHSLHHPAGLLRSFFDVLYDEDIISEDAFMQWAKSTDPNEQAGKGVAQSSVVQFFTWLREADEESQDDN